MKITIINGDDWKGLYIDGKLVFENHQLEVDDFCQHCNIEAEFIEPDEQWFEQRLIEGSYLPENLVDVKRG